MQPRANRLIGVFISITTIPAAADVGVSLACHSGPEAGASAIQLLLNVGLLIMIGALALQLLRRMCVCLRPRGHPTEGRSWAAIVVVGDRAEARLCDGGHPALHL